MSQVNSYYNFLFLYVQGVIRKFAENSCLINRAGITAHNTARHMQLICYNMLDCYESTCATVIVKAMLYSAIWPILRCILTFYFTTN